MLRITLHQMRQNIGRLTAAGIAILIGTAFIAATLLAGQVFIKSTERSMTAEYADADFVVSASFFTEDEEGTRNYEYEPFTAQVLDDLAEIPNIGNVAIASAGYVEISTGEKQEYLPSSTYSDDPRLQTSTLVEGQAPTSDSHVTLPKKVSDRLGLAIGDSVTLDYYGGNDEGNTSRSFTVTGLVEDTRGAFAESGGAMVLTQEGLTGLYSVGEGVEADSLPAENVLVTVSDGIRDDSSAVAEFRQQVEQASGKRLVQTTTEAAEAQIKQLSGEANILTSMVLTFAAIALLVASLVISNTFQVLIAQRTKTLALLRCVGASKKQIKRSVIVEALILGAAASIAGILSGLILVQAILSIVSALELSNNVPTVISVSAMSIWLPLVAGILTTLLASFVPARIATQVAPLAALRPQEGSGEVRRTGVVRIVISSILVLIGVALFVLAFSIQETAVNMALLAGIAGGAFSFIGLILGAVLWVPSVVSAVGSLFARFGAPAQLAAANIGRNPRRTASTSTALFIGVTLVALLSVGASTARTSLNEELDAQFPLDVTLSFYAPEFNPSASADSDDSSATQANSAQQNMESMLDSIRKIEGVASAEAVRSISTSIMYSDQDFSESTTVYEFSDAVKETLRDPAPFESLKDTTVMTSQYASWLEKGSEVSFLPGDLAYQDGALADSPQWADRVTLETTNTAGLDGYLVTANTFATMLKNFDVSESDITNSLVFVKVADASAAMDTVDALRDKLSDQDVSISGSVMIRDQFQMVIDVMLLVLVGLLGVAVLIALIGVANTLSLSVIERRRESATLRAVGMSRRQLRMSLAIEGLLIAGIGALVGVVLGSIYAWFGTELLLGAFTEPRFTISWTHIALIFAVALISGLLASIVPGRHAARTSPVAALAVE